MDQIEQHQNTLDLTTRVSTSIPALQSQLYPHLHCQTHAHHHSLPYYTLEEQQLESRHEPFNGCVTDILSQGSASPRLYPTRVADVKDDNLTVRPPLRKKPKLNSQSTSSRGMLRSVGIAKTVSVPSFTSISHNTAPDLDDHRPSSSSGIGQSSHPLHRTNSSTLQRTSSQRRPPASHSSYGIETTLGPPPSYSTQRTLSQDRIRLDRNASSNTVVNTSRETSPTRITREASPTKTRRDSSPSKPNDSTPSIEYPPARLSPIKVDATSSTFASSDDVTTQEASSPATPETDSLLTPFSNMSKDYMTANPDAIDLPENQNAAPSLLKPLSSEDDSKGSSSDEKKSEDLFLNIARTDAPRGGGQPQAKVEKRRSRASLPFLSSSRPSTGIKSSPIQEQFDTTSVSGRSEALNYYHKRASLGQHVPGAFPRTYARETATRDAGLETQSSHPAADFPRRAMSRRYSQTNLNTITNGEPRASSRPSTARNGRLASDGGAFLDHPRLPDHNATESTISTTAPSTVWDELDDLKSRIKKLELTGKLPPSSAAAMTTAERPKTATTAATTMSSSPKHKPTTVATLTSAIEGIPSNIHPNLHEALGNAKAILSNEVYQKLQATAHDALQLSIMMSPEAHNAVGSTIGITTTSERQIRRRTETMCRSLTELAIAILAENKPQSQTATRPGSRDAHQPVSGLRSRRYSNEPNDRPPVTSRVQSRLETRRTSAAVGTTGTAQATPPETPYQTPPTAVPPVSTTSSSRVARTTSLVRSRRTPGYNAGGPTDDEEGSPSVRPVSRAMTEIGTQRQTRDRAAYSREYTAQHPLPQQHVPSPVETSSASRSQLPAHVSTHLIPRRKYGNLSSNASNVGTPQDGTPITPKEPWGRISVVPTVASSPIEAPPDSPASVRPPNSRRSFGFTSRISSVSSRLRAAKGDRTATLRDIAPSEQVLDNRTPLERHGSGQSMES